MAQLRGVKVVSNDTIDFGGNRYEKSLGQGAPGDIVRSDYNYSFLPIGTFYLVGEDGKYSDFDGSTYAADTEKDDEITLFRKVSAVSTADMLRQKCAQLTQLVAEVAELEKKRDEIRAELIAKIDAIAKGDV